VFIIIIIIIIIIIKFLNINTSFIFTHNQNGLKNLGLHLLLHKYIMAKSLLRVEHVTNIQPLRTFPIFHLPLYTTIASPEQFVRPQRT